MSGAQFGDPKELRPVALGEAPFGIRLYDSRPDGRPPVSEKMLNQTMKGLDFSACQIGSDRRCATRTGHGEPVGPDHSLEFRRHKSRMASCADSPGVILRTRHTGSSTKGVRRSTGLLHRRHFLTLPFRAFWHRGGRSDGHRFAVLPAGAGCSIIGRRHAPVPLRSGCAAGVRRTLLRGQRSCSSSRSTPSFLLLQQDD
nr:uncharacterized protein LOC133579586 isoform X2 [Nerophis lumbriciformis]